MECVGHIQKRLRKRLHDLKKKTFVDDSGQVRKIKWGGKGRLTESVINSLSVYFGGAIRNFPGDMDGMFRAIWAVFHHSISDDEQHHHQFCPTGSDSWCKFNRALADNVEPPKHTPKLPKDLGPFIKPVFTALSKRELLENSVLGATQNQNESFNIIVWSWCPKKGFCSVASVDIISSNCCYTHLLVNSEVLELLDVPFQSYDGFCPWIDLKIQKETTRNTNDER